MNATTRATALLALAPLALGALGACGGGSRTHSAPPSEILPSAGPVELPTTPELQEIAVLEEARDPGAGRLAELASTGSRGVRVAATRALGRIPLWRSSSDVSQALTTALADPAPEVRAMAAFGIGLRADPATAGVLLDFWNDPEPAVRASIVQAAGKLSHAALREEIRRSMGDEDDQVRIEAVTAPHRWPTDAPDAREVDRALMLVLSRYPNLPPPPGEKGAPGAEVIWHTLFTLARRSSEQGEGAFLEHSDSADARVRMFATKGLGRIQGKDTGAIVATLSTAAGDQDWRVVVEAVTALGLRADPAGADAVMAAVEHSNSNVRVVAMTALAEFPSRKKDCVPLLWRGNRDISPQVRAYAKESLARLLPPDEAEDIVRTGADAGDEIDRWGAARAARHLPSARAVPLLQALAADPDLLVAGAAIEGLGEHPTRESRETLQQFVVGEDRGLQLAAVLALRESAQASDLKFLTYALQQNQRSDEDIAVEVTFNVLENLGRLGTAESKVWVVSAQTHDDPYVREVAVRVLREHYSETGASTEVAARSRPRLPLPGADYPVWRANPLVEVRTTRGNLVFELFPGVAPLHVHSFLQLAEAGHYEELTFHRIVPNFVVQGGDYRGDGNGGRSWRGDSLRHEFSPLEYVRGSLGMPRNENWESGGSQIFITHRPTPHLDGLYTQFGQLRSGYDVLDKIEMGDRILSVKLLPPGS